MVDEKKGLNGFYRFHIPDPVQFQQDCKVTIQQLGGTSKGEVKTMMKDGLPAKPVACIQPTRIQYNFLGPDAQANFDDKDIEDGTFTVFYREDDLCATSYFYLDSPVNDLPPVPDFEMRNANLRGK